MSHKLPIVEVDWVDSMSASGWRSAKEVAKYSAEAQAIKSVGYMLTKDRKKVILVGSLDAIDHDGEVQQFNHYHEIPRGCVKRIRRIG